MSFSYWDHHQPIGVSRKRKEDSKLSLFSFEHYDKKKTRTKMDEEEIIEVKPTVVSKQLQTRTKIRRQLEVEVGNVARKKRKIKTKIDEEEITEVKPTAITKQPKKRNKTQPRLEVELGNVPGKKEKIKTKIDDGEEIEITEVKPTAITKQPKKRNKTQPRLEVKLVRLSPGEIGQWCKTEVKLEIPPDSPSEKFEFTGDRVVDVDPPLVPKPEDDDTIIYNCVEVGAEYRSFDRDNILDENVESDSDSETQMVKLLIDNNRQNQMKLINSDCHNNEVFIPSTSSNNLASFIIPSIMNPFEEHPGVHMGLTPCPPLNCFIGYLHIYPNTLRPLDAEFDRTVIYWVINTNVVVRSAGSRKPTTESGNEFYMYPSNFPPGACIVVPPRTYYLIENRHETEVATLAVVKFPRSDQ